ncbi:glycosyl hydrolase catalytic core-domain-containing protein [Apodospora peruviana]|uniref:Glycosyl hydrolase catalytic core-domain-containing protein n=1 Tax=Apodospora peruviana TaxID=516989 RepID=A0AAE0HYM7_9PEZI|nr:glycosyl hydrolase catalytic core-domain-containing protein [Apodospora peruviana]
MFTQALVALAAASLFGQAVAAGPHQAHQHIHQKRALVTEVTTVTDWVTVYVTGGADATKVHMKPTRKAKKPKTTSTTAIAAAAPSSPAPAPAPVATTLATLQKPATSEAAAVPAPVPTPEAQPAPKPEPATTAAPAAPAPPAVEVPAVVNSPAATIPAAAPVKNTAGHAQRGLAYNHAELLPGFLQQGSKVTWAYNWGQVGDAQIGLEFVPMMWSPGKGFDQTWAANAQKAIDAGSKCLLSFNEPDNDGQANMSPADAAKEHIKHMNPWAGQARIGSPAITNSGAKNQGIDWMQQFFTACEGQCAVDFVVAHAYGIDGDQFLQHLVNVHDAFQKPVWVTEFAFGGSDEQISQTLAHVISELETNPKYSFVERYAYFYAAQGSMVSGNGPNLYGNTFAYGP